MYILSWKQASLSNSILKLRHGTPPRMHVVPRRGVSIGSGAGAIRHIGCDVNGYGQRTANAACWEKDTSARDTATMANFIIEDWSQETKDRVADFLQQLALDVRKDRRLTMFVSVPRNIDTSEGWSIDIQFHKDKRP